MGQEISLANIGELDLEIVKQYNGDIIDIVPDEENPKWKVNIIVSQDHMKPYVRLRTRKGEPVVKLKDTPSPTCVNFPDFFHTGENETFPKPSSKDELRAFDDKVFVTGTRSLPVCLRKWGRTRSIPDLATLKKKAKAPSKPKFFDKFLSNVRLSRKAKSSGALCQYREDSSDEDDINVFTDETKECHKSIEEITAVDVEGSLLQGIEEDITKRRLFSDTFVTNSVELSGTLNKESLSIENKKPDSSAKTQEDQVNVKTITKKRSSSEEARNVTAGTSERSKSLDGEPVAKSTPNSPETTHGIVQDRLARFKKIAEQVNNVKNRRSMSVPSSPDLNRRDFFKGDDHIALFKKVQNKFGNSSNMTEEERVQFGGVAVKAGYVKTLVDQLNKNKGGNSEEINVSHKNASPVKNTDIKIVNINDESEHDKNDDVSQTNLNNNNVDSGNSSNRNSLKSSDCGGTSDTQSSVQEQTETESGIVSDGISSINPAELFDSSWSESDIDSLHSTDSEDESCSQQHEVISPKDSIDSKGFTESTEAPKDKIQKIVEELWSTEKAYVQRLKLLVQAFRFKVVQENKIHNFLPDGVIPQMFSNVQSIYQFHNDFLLPQIEKRAENWTPESKIGDMMKQYAPLLKMYTEYVKNFDNAMNLITVWSDKSPKFSAIIKEIQMTEECGSLTLQHHMLEPVQRIPRYEMLLKDYLKRLPEDAADRADAQAALELVTTAACHSNEAMKKIDKFNKLLEIVRKIDTNENLISPTRELLREGRITKISARGGERLERFLFLFNDLMLICFEPLLGSYKIKSQLEMDGMEIMERSDKCLRWILEGESIDIPNTFYVKSRQKIIQFLDENANGEPSGWCETIKETINNYKRKKAQKGNSIEEANRNSGLGLVELGKVAPKWIKDDEVTMCMKCATKFTAIRRRHHCRACGDVVCGKCSSKKVPLSYDDNHLNRVCDDCYQLLKCDDDDVTGHHHDKHKKKKDILQINASDPSVLSGYLQVSSDKGKNWHKRWVAIHNDFVLYTFKAHQDPYAITSLPLPGHIVEDIEKVEHADKEHLFKISHKRSSLLLSSESAASKTRWMYVLGKVVVAELPEDVDDTQNNTLKRNSSQDNTSKRDSSNSSSSNDCIEINAESEHSHL